MQIKQTLQAQNCFFDETFTVGVKIKKKKIVK